MYLDAPLRTWAKRATVMISHSYHFSPRAPHSAFVARLVRLGRDLGVLASPPAVEMTRRHRMMFEVDERRHRRLVGWRGGDLVPPVAAVSQPTQFGPLCFAVATMGAAKLPMVFARSARDEGIDALLRTEHAYLALDRRHRERVRSCGLNDADATCHIRARERRIRLLDRLRDRQAS